MRTDEDSAGYRTRGKLKFLNQKSLLSGRLVESYSVFGASLNHLVSADELY